MMIYTKFNKRRCFPVYISFLVITIICFVSELVLKIILVKRGRRKPSPLCARRVSLASAPGLLRTHQAFAQLGALEPPLFPAWSTAFQILEALGSSRLKCLLTGPHVQRACIHPTSLTALHDPAYYLLLHGLCPATSADAPVGETAPPLFPAENTCWVEPRTDLEGQARGGCDPPRAGP